MGQLHGNPQEGFRHTRMEIDMDQQTIEIAIEIMSSLERIAEALERANAQRDRQFVDIHHTLSQIERGTKR